MKIYTRTGDDGTTGLMGPGRVSKSAPRVEAYGSVDELNAALGTVIAQDAQGWLTVELRAIQSHLFAVGAELATPDPDLLARLEPVPEEQIVVMEQWIDRYDRDLPPLRSFILPGGTELAARLHLARTVCRRAERRVVDLAGGEPVHPRLVRYLNRLGDLLFVMARWSNHRAGVREIEWTSGRGTKS